MKYQLNCAAALAVASVLGAATLTRAAGDAKPSENSNQQMDYQKMGHKSAKPNVQLPDGWVVIEEDAVVLTADEPQNHFIRAQQALDQKQPREAAGELRVAAAYLDMQASRGNGQDDDPQLSQQADHLRQAAGQILSSKAEDEKKDTKEFSHDFEQSDLALSQHLQMLAKSELGSGKLVMAGHDLQAATDSLNAAYVWSNQQPPKSVASEIQDAQRVSDELMSPQPSAGNGDTQAGKPQAAASKMEPDGKATANMATAPKGAAKCVDKFGQTIESAQNTLSKSDQASAGT